MKTFLRFAFASLVASLSLQAQVPSLMSYQGRVSDSSGALLGNSSPINRTVTFKFYTTSTGGSPIYAEAQTVTISAGEFSVLIGNGTGVSGLPGPSAPAVQPYTALASIVTADHAGLYLGITVDDGTSAADPEITPRQQIVSSAYSMRAKVAETVLSGALNTSMLANSAVTTEKIAGASVTTDKIASSAIDSSKIAVGSVGSNQIANGSVTNEKLSANAITSDKIADRTIGNADLADNIVNSAKITDGDVRSIDIADGNVTTVDLADQSVTNVKVANNAIDYNKLAAAIQQSLCPVGTILPYAGDNAPAGWLLCNGATISRSTYSALYSVIGNRFGAGDGGSTFHVPDFRGRFLRGRDGGVGRDEDRNSRGAMNWGGATGDAVGSVQDEMFRWHSHGYKDVYFSEAGGDTSVFNGAHGSGKSDWDNSAWQIGRTTDGNGGNETRPDNANVNYIIKY